MGKTLKPSVHWSVIAGLGLCIGYITLANKKPVDKGFNRHFLFLFKTPSFIRGENAACCCASILLFNKTFIERSNGFYCVYKQVEMH